MLYPSPEEQYIAKEELLELIDKASRKMDILLAATFKRPEIYDAWYAKVIERTPMRVIAAAQGISRYAVGNRIRAAKEIIAGLQRQMHLVDDEGE